MTQPVKVRYHQGERGFAIPQPDGTYIIDNLPFDGGVVNFRDIVEVRAPADPTAGDPFVVRIVKRIAHAWSVVEYEPTTHAMYSVLRTAAELHGLATEGSFPGTMVVASNVEDKTELESILSVGVSAKRGQRVRIVDHRVLLPAPVDLPDLHPDYGTPAPTAGRPGPAIVRR